MKNYRTPEFEMIRIAEFGDIITLSPNTVLGNIGGTDVNEDYIDFGSPNNSIT